MSPIKYFELNNDDSSKGTLAGVIRMSNTGGVIRDSSGKCIVEYMGNLQITNNIKTDLTTLIQGLHIVLARGFYP